MGDYRRWVSYIREYSNKQDRVSVGYARIESRNEKCRILLNIKKNGIDKELAEVFIFYRDGKDNILIPMGNMMLQDGGVEFIYETTARSIAGSGKSLEQLAGIAIVIDERFYFATVWDDRDFCMKRSRIIRENRETVYAAHNELDESRVGDRKVDEGNYEELTSEELPTTKADEEISEFEMLSQAERIFRRYPQMYPFEDNEIAECVKIDPQDIGVLPMDKWMLANNSFLLHGYYAYRHLIFAKIKGVDDEDEYILGVPGMNREREKSMANMFGFERFKSICADSRNIGEFGYWYMEIDFSHQD